MSIEELFAKLVKAIEENTDAVEKQNAILLTATTKGTATSASARRAVKKQAEAEAAEKEPAEAAEKELEPKKKTAAKKKKTAPRKPSKATLKKTRADLNTELTKFIGELRKSEDKDEQASKLAQVKEILETLDAKDENDPKGSYKISAIPDDNVMQAKEYFTKFFAGEDVDLPTQDEEPEEEDEEEEMSF